MGYIVGFFNAYDMELITDTTDPLYEDYNMTTNVAIALESEENDTRKIVVVGLPEGEFRDAINLINNPSNLGKKLAVDGKIFNYNGISEINSVTDYKLNPENPIYEQIDATYDNIEQYVQITVPPNTSSGRSIIVELRTNDTNRKVARASLFQYGSN